MAGNEPERQQITTKERAQQLFSAPVVATTAIQDIAMNLYGLGFNVFPVPYGKKGGWPWQRLQYVRLNPEDIPILFMGRCNVAVMTGRTSNNLFVIDCETKKTFEYHERMLRSASIPIWAVRSGGNRGGGHFYLLSKEGEVKGVKAGERTDYEVRGNRCYVLTTPSLHPDGRLYDWHLRETPVPPIVTLEQVDWLSLRLAKTSPKDISPNPFSELSQTTQAFIFTGASPGERNDRLFSAACDMAGNNFDQHTTTQTLLPIALRSGLTEKAIRATIASAFSKPRTPAKGNQKKLKYPTPHERAVVWAQHHHWSGKAGQTDRAVFLACCERCQIANEHGIFRASSREIASLARVTRKTASKALRRLREDKLLVFCGTDTGSGASLFRFGKLPDPQLNPSGGDAEENLRIYPTISLPFFGFTNGVLSPKNDALETGALNKTAYMLYQAMCAVTEPMRAQVLSSVSRLTVHQVYRGLSRLREYGLVDKVPGGFIAHPMPDERLDEVVSRTAGTLGKGEARRIQFQRERAELAAKPLYVARWHDGLTVLEMQQQMVQRWKCANCGQVWSMPGLEPPLVCDFCGDVTTWKRLPR